MHELSLCQQIISQVDKAIDKHRSIKTIILTIGRLAAVDCDALRFWFPVASKGTRMAGVGLVINTLDALARCKVCEHNFKMSERLTACPTCSGYEYLLLSGTELKIKQVELI